MAPFRTDRGDTLLPAWRITAREVAGTIWVLDPELADWRPPPGAGGRRPDDRHLAPTAGRAVAVSADGVTLTAEFIGGAPQDSRVTRRDAIEDLASVAVLALVENVGPPGVQPAAGHLHRVEFALREPLGDRVLVDLRGEPLVVTAA